MIRHHFVTVGDRQVHYRRAGTGPPVALFHESPLSSLSLVGLVEALSSRFAAIAPDTPGYGLSDPLALEVARRYPAHVASAVLDALPVFADEEDTEFLDHYLPPLMPDEFGRHLVWAWNRVRDGHLFFPWHRREFATRLDTDVPDARGLHEGAMDLLRTRSGYRKAYAAAFRHGGSKVREAISGLQVPTAIVAHEDDPLRGHLGRLPDRLPEGVRKEKLPRDRASREERIVAILAEGPAGDAAPQAPAAGPVPGRIIRDYADTSFGQLLVRRRDEAGGRPLVMLHPSPTSSALLEPLMNRLAPRRPVVAFDTLGNGDSDKPDWEEARIRDYAPVVNEALDRLGLGEVDLYGSHTGAVIAIETAIARPERVGNVVLDGVTLWDESFVEELLERYTISLAPRDDGTHLVSAWNLMRDATLFWPHYNRTREGIRWVEPAGKETLHLLAVELLKSGESYPMAYRAALAYPTRERLPLLKARALILGKEGDMLDRYADEVASLVPNAKARHIGASGSAAAEIEEFLDGAR